MDCCFLRRTITGVAASLAAFAFVVGYPASRAHGQEGNDARGAGPQVIDVNISLYGIPLQPDFPVGDDNGNTQNTVTPSEQDAYEIIIQHFADALYEATDGQHMLGTVRIFQQARRADDADIVWGPRGIPSSRVAGGLGVAGGHMVMFDMFPGANADGSDLNVRATLENMQVGGYLLAQRWLEHSLSILNEFPERGGDVPVSMSVMNDPYAAAATDSSAGLNLSVPGDMMAPFTAWESTLLTSQERYFGASAWTVISRNYGDRKLPQHFAYPPRIVFPELSVGPLGGGGLPRIDLGPTTPPPGNFAPASRAALDIIWDNAIRDIFLVIDTSGSMAGSPIANAQEAAKLVIDKAITGQTRIGIVEFNTSAFVHAPLTAINNDATRVALRSIIDSFTAIGGTDMRSGLAAAAIQLAPSTNATRRIIHLLSDGVSSTPTLDLIPGIDAAGINIFSIAFGEFADRDTLRALAEGTDGNFTATTTDLADIVLAFDRANALAMGSSPSRLEETLLREETQTFEFFVGPSATRLDATVVHDTLPAGSFVRMTDPNGAEVLPYRSADVSGGTVQNFVIDGPVSGTWTLIAVSRLDNLFFAFGANELELNSRVVLRAHGVNGTDIVYPTPMTIQANLSSILGVNSVALTAVHVAPNGLARLINLRDDGIAPDVVARDGTYSAIVSYTTSGFHEVLVELDNALGTGRATYNGTLRAPSNSLTGAEPAPTIPDATITVPFRRVASIQTNVSGILSDDHGDTAVLATPVPADNGDVPSRFERPGDVDVFRVVVPGGVTTLAVRASEVSGNQTVGSVRVRVFQVDGTTLLATGTRASGGYVLALVENVTPGQVLFVFVDDFTNRGPGTYNFSAGSIIYGDLTGGIAFGSGGGGGGGGGCFIATAAYGTPLETEINALRDARDAHLLTNPFGAVFADTYYRLSPPIADWVAGNAVARGAVRGALGLILHPAWLVMLLGAAGAALALARAARPAAIRRRSR